MSSIIVLLVDDDADIRAEMSAYFKSHGVDVVEAEDTQAARHQLSNVKVDLIILDLWIGKDNGFDFLAELRRSHATPCIMVTAQSEETDKVVGLELGADDYVTKPVMLRELLARMRALLRRSKATVNGSVADHDHMLNDPDARTNWKFDQLRRELSMPDGAPVPLTTAEYNLLIELVTSMGMPRSRDDLCQRVFNRPWQPYDRSLDSIVVKLRRKLEPDPDRPVVIKTIRGQGYVFTGFPEGSPLMTGADRNGL